MAETTAVVPASEPPKTPPPTVPPTHQTPIAHKSLTQPFSMDATRDMKKEYERIAIEAKDYFVVGMDPQTFLEELLPWNDTTPDAYRGKHPSKQRLKDLRSVAPKTGQAESVMYKPFVKALSGWVTKVALTNAKVPNPQTLRFLNTKRPDTSCNNLNPDISTYWNDGLKAHTDFSRQQTHQEFKTDRSHDGFQNVSDENPGDTDEGEEEEEEEEKEKDEEDRDQTDVNVALNDDALLQLSPGEQEPQKEENIALDEANIPTPSASSSVETDTESGIHTRGQITAYAGVGLSMSFRNHFFSMLILGPYARFIRGPSRSRRHSEIRLHQAPTPHLQFLPTLWPTHTSSERVRPHS
ncbi:hypothetical protein BYT27DRAFT_7203023 [Phlegmacium glaucopus]|nr:hypothetical protein BYT27DRAFT_7203023 [Phlegmacium glaucopus]